LQQQLIQATGDLATKLQSFNSNEQQLAGEKEELKKAQEQLDQEKVALKAKVQESAQKEQVQSER